MANARKLRWVAALGGAALLATVAFAVLRLGGSVRLAPADEADSPGPGVSFSLNAAPGLEEEMAAQAEVAEDTPEGQLVLAARNGDAARARELLAEGVPPNAEESKNGHRPLHQAAEAGHAPIVDLLLDAGADLDAQDGAGRTALMRAAAAAAVDAGRRLLEAGAAVNALSANGTTALAQVVNGGMLRRARGGMTDAVTATHDAEMEFARMLFERGADPNLRSEEAAPPLKVLAMTQNIELLSLFVDNGAWADSDFEMTMLSKMGGPVGEALTRAMANPAPETPTEPEAP